MIVSASTRLDFRPVEMDDSLDRGVIYTGEWSTLIPVTETEEDSEILVSLFSQWDAEMAGKRITQKDVAGWVEGYRKTND